MPAEVNGPEIVRAGNVEVRLTPVRNREKDYVHLAWYFAGERRQKMLRCADRNDEKRIREMAREIASAVWTARPDKIPELSINVRIMNAAREALNGFDVEIDAACREYSAARTVIGDHGSLLDAAEFYRRSKPVALKPVTIERAVDEFIASQLSESLSYQYRKEICRGLRLFARDMAGSNIAEITTSQLQSWLRNLKRQDGQPLTARSRNNFRDQIVTMFRWAQSEGGYLRRDVTTEAEWTKKVKTHTDIHIFTVEQFRTLIYGAVEHDPRCIHYLAIGTFGFVRPKEIERMSPASVRFHHNDIEVREDEAKRTRRQSNRRLVPSERTAHLSRGRHDGALRWHGHALSLVRLRSERRNRYRDGDGESETMSQQPEFNVEDLLNERAALVGHVHDLNAQLTTINGKINASRRLPLSEYQSLCTKRGMLAADKQSVESRLIVVKTQPRIANIHHDAQLPSNGESAPIVRELSAVRQKYQEFAADGSRISSMRKMAAEFVLELNPIIKGAIRLARGEQ